MAGEMGSRVSDAAFFNPFAQGGMEEVGVAIGAAAGLEQAVEFAVMGEEDAAAVGGENLSESL